MGLVLVAIFREYAKISQIRCKSTLDTNLNEGRQNGGFGTDVMDGQMSTNPRFMFTAPDTSQDSVPPDAVEMYQGVSRTHNHK